MIKKTLVVLIFLHCITNVQCQDNYSQLFYNDFSSLNPAYVGMLEKKQATFYTYEYNSKDFDINLSNGRVALNIPISKIYSGIGLHSSYSKLDIFSDLDFGLIYSFKYDITDNIKVSIGSNFSVFRNKIKGTLWFPDKENLNEYQEYVNEDVYLFNIDIGFWLKVYGVQIGLTNKHINEASKEMHLVNEPIIYGLRSNMNLILNYDLHIFQRHSLKSSFLIYDLKDFSERKYFVLNNQFAFNNKLIVGLTTEIYKSEDIQAYLSPNVGFNLSDKFDFIMSVELIKINSGSLRGNAIEAVLNYNF